MGAHCAWVLEGVQRNPPVHQLQLVDPAVGVASPFARLEAVVRRNIPQPEHVGRLVELHDRHVPEGALGRDLHPVGREHRVAMVGVPHAVHVQHLPQVRAPAGADGDVEPRVPPDERARPDLGLRLLAELERLVVGRGLPVGGGRERPRLPRLGGGARVALPPRHDVALLPLVPVDGGLVVGGFPAAGQQLVEVAARRRRRGDDLLLVQPYVAEVAQDRRAQVHARFLRRAVPARHVVLLPQIPYVAVVRDGLPDRLGVHVGAEKVLVLEGFHYPPKVVHAVDSSVVVPCSGQDAADEIGALLGRSLHTVALGNLPLHHVLAAVAIRLSVLGVGVGLHLALAHLWLRDVGRQRQRRLQRVVQPASRVEFHDARVGERNLVAVPRRAARHLVNHPRVHAPAVGRLHLSHAVRVALVGRELRCHVAEAAAPALYHPRPHGGRAGAHGRLAAEVRGVAVPLVAPPEGDALRRGRALRPRLVAAGVPLRRRRRRDAARKFVLAQQPAQRRLLLDLERVHQHPHGRAQLALHRLAYVLAVGGERKELLRAHNGPLPLNQQRRRVHGRLSHCSAGALGDHRGRFVGRAQLRLCGVEAAPAVDRLVDGAQSGQARVVVAHPVFAVLVRADVVALRVVGGVPVVRGAGSRGRGVFLRLVLRLAVARIVTRHVVLRVAHCGVALLRRLGRGGVGPPPRPVPVGQVARLHADHVLAVRRLRHLRVGGLRQANGRRAVPHHELIQVVAVPDHVRRLARVVAGSVLTVQPISVLVNDRIHRSRYAFRRKADATVLQNPLCN
ncbi:microspherule protein 1 [Babesia caballi]|uniref:Microspherule protein 1 n=1 Tax=Babesia caballi TaxID=5871 RepID=A0AAV4LYS9_BABCB|nr:microspherule protein 1 [Babesia caballi]